jgi:nucleotide-binding universal stress UspA family protein
MAKRVLVPIDGSPQAYAAFEHALEEFPDATIVALTVLNPSEMGAGSAEMGMGSYADRWLELEEERTEEQFERLRETASEYGVTVETETTVGRPTRAIVDYAEEHGFDQVVMGSHGRDGVSRILLGSVAETVVRRAPCPVTVVR